MYYIILIVLVIVTFLCVRIGDKKEEEYGYSGIGNIIISLCTYIFALVFFCFGIVITPSTYSTVSSTETQSEISEFNKSTLINKENETSVITYKTENGIEIEVTADENTNILIKNENPSKVIFKKELIYSVWVFQHEEILTYTFQ